MLALALAIMHLLFVLSDGGPILMKNACLFRPFHEHRVKRAFLLLSFLGRLFYGALSGWFSNGSLHALGGLAGLDAFERFLK